MNNQAIYLLRKIVEAIDNETGDAPISETRTFLSNLVERKKYLSLLNTHDPDNQVILDQIETSLTEEQTIELDEFLKKNQVLSHKLELAITEDI